LFGDADLGDEGCDRGFAFGRGAAGDGVGQVVCSRSMVLGGGALGSASIVSVISSARALNCSISPRKALRRGSGGGVVHGAVPGSPGRGQSSSLTALSW